MKGHLSTLTQTIASWHFQKKKKFQGTEMFRCDTCVHGSLKVVFFEWICSYAVSLYMWEQQMTTKKQNKNVITNLIIGVSFLNQLQYYTCVLNTVRTNVPNPLQPFSKSNGFIVYLLFVTLSQLYPITMIKTRLD